MNDPTQHFTQLADLASERLGGKALAANDEFFAPKENLLKESKPILIEGKYTPRGKWMDGWETRRRRTPGYDWCIIRLGLPGMIRGVVVDTSFFTGNFPERVSLEACDLGGAPFPAERKRLESFATKWTEILPETSLQGNSVNPFSVANENRFTHVRLKIHPDGGVARLRIHGQAVPGAKRISRGEIDLVAVENGGTVVTSSDQFYGAPRNLLMPYRAKNMGDGWETQRRRGPGYDWVILKLGLPGNIRRVVVDTAHFKGNYPDRCSLEACRLGPSEALSDSRQDSLAGPQVWKELLPETKLKPNARHVLSKLNDVGTATHVRFNIYPDGGVSRLRLFGQPISLESQAGGITNFNQLLPEQARSTLLDCCGSHAWAEQMLAHMPFPDVACALDTADKIWAALDREDWLAAFRHHPMIGAKRGKRVQSPTARGWSKEEQATAQKANAAIQSALVDANRSYQARFGHIFLICATGKTSDEILNTLQERMSNDPETELAIAAEEQHKITRLRLERILTS